LNIKKIFTLPKSYKSTTLSNLLYQTHMTVMYVAFPFTIFVTTSSPARARDSNSINTTEYDWPGLYYTRLGQTTINFNGTSLRTTAIIRLAPSWHISHHWLQVLPVRPRHRRRLALTGHYGGVK